MVTVPNQRVINIHRERATANFLGIKNENWQAAARDLGAHALLLYMYFAANRDNYSIALSPKAIRDTIGMPPQTYRDQFVKLVNKGYLVLRSGNTYDFYETPQTVNRSKDDDNCINFDNTTTVEDTTVKVQTTTVDNIEININDINNINRACEKQVSRRHKPEDMFRF